MTEIGIDVKTMNVARRSRRNRKTISMTRNPPTSACSWTAWIERLMKIELSSSTVIVTLGTSRLILATSDAHGVGDLDRVGARLLGDAQPDARLAVDARERAEVLGRILDLRDVAHVDRHAGSRHDDQVTDLVQVLELALAADEVGAVALVDLAERDVLVLGAQQVDDAIDREVECADLFLRELDVDLTAQAAFDRDGGDAGHALQALRQVVLGDLAQPDAIVDSHGLEADAHDRRRARVELEHHRRLGFFRETAAHAIEPVADVVRGLVQVRAPRQVERDARRALRRGRLETLEAGDGAERLFDRPRHELFHLERSDAGVADADGDAREGHVGHQVDGQPDERQAANQHDDRRQHEHRDRTLDR